MTKAALHLDPNTHRLLGVWTSLTEAYYPGASLASQTGTRAMQDHLSGSWEEWIGRLEGRNPGEISWESTALEGDETPHDVFARLTSLQ